MVRHVVVLVASLLLVGCTADPLVKKLSSFQAPTGGFVEIASEGPDLETTAQSLFLASLYGLKSQIKTDAALQYVQGLESSSDSGYGLSAGVPSDLPATRAAILAHHYLGEAIPNADKVSEYILSLFKDGLFASRASDGGDIKSTAFAVESLKLLGELEKPAVQDILERVKEKLSASVATTTNGAKYFSFDSATNSLSDDYYGILLATECGFEFEDTEDWAEHIILLQDGARTSPTYGGFFTSEAKMAVTAESTAHATLALKLLDSSSSVDENALFQYTQAKRQGKIRDAAFAHLAGATTTLFTKHALRPLVSYDASGENEDQILEGEPLVPKALLAVVNGKFPHGGMSASVVVRPTGADEETWSMPYDAESFQYVADDSFDTSGYLGPISMSYTFSTEVYPLGKIAIKLSDTKRVGYNMEVDGTAMSNGRELLEEDQAVPGTEFTFNVGLATRTQAQITQGDFVVKMSVTDSSGVVQHTDTLDASSNAGEITFEYTLVGDDFTPGAVEFLFEVSESDSDVVHTTQTLSYVLAQQLVAMNIEVNGGTDKPSLRLGEELTVSVEIGSLKDLNSAVPLSAKNGGSRRFLMQLLSGKGKQFHAVVGNYVEPKYEFEVSLEHSLDFARNTVIGFQYLPAGGNPIDLVPFNAEKNELYTDARDIGYTVDASLQIADVTSAPTAEEFTLGTSVPFEFSIEDSVTSEKVSPGRLSQVVAVLKTSGDKFESAKAVASEGEDSAYTASLAIDANAVKGKGTLEVQGVGVDGEAMPLAEGADGSKSVYPASVVGDIAVSHDVFTTRLSDALSTVFVAKFQLSANEVPLSNARLSASIVSADGNVVKIADQDLSQLAVAAGGEGEYQLSVTGEHHNLQAGQYKLKFVREVDVQRAQGKGSTPEPLFEIEVSHPGRSKGGVWMQMEVITVTILGALYVGISSHNKLFGKKHS